MVASFGPVWVSRGYNGGASWLRARKVRRNRRQVDIADRGVGNGFRKVVVRGGGYEKRQASGELVRGGITGKLE